MTDRPAAPASKQPETELLKPDEPLNSNSLNLVDQVGTGGAKAPKPSAEPSELTKAFREIATPLVGLSVIETSAMVREILADRKEEEALKALRAEAGPRAPNHPTPLRDTPLAAREISAHLRDRLLPTPEMPVSRAQVTEAIFHQPAARSWNAVPDAGEFIVKPPAANIEEFTVTTKNSTSRAFRSVLGAAAINVGMDYTAFAGVPTSERTVGWDIASQFIYALPRGGLLAKGGALVAQHWLNREIDRGQQEETNADELAPLAIVPRKIDDVFAKALLESQRRYSTIELHQSRISKDNREFNPALLKTDTDSARKGPEPLKQGHLLERTAQGDVRPMMYEHIRSETPNKAYVPDLDAMKAAIEAVVEKK